MLLKKKAIDYQYGIEFARICLPRELISKCEFCKIKVGGCHIHVKFKCICIIDKAYYQYGYIFRQYIKKNGEYNT